MKYNEKVKAAQEKDRNARKMDKKGNTTQQQRTPFPFKPTDRILLVGEGNFSFALALSNHSELRHMPATNLTATTYDSEETCLHKYPDAGDILHELRRKGVNTVFEVDGVSLQSCPALKHKTWDRIVWNFPHTGNGISDQDRNIHANQLLLLGFLRSSANLLTRGAKPVAHTKRRKLRIEPDDLESSDEEEEENIIAEKQRGTRGTILVTLRNVKPYTEWELPRLAKNPPSTHPENPRYAILHSFIFPREEWSRLGYAHRMTKGYVEGTGTGADRAKASGKDGGEDRCWEFYLC